MFKFKCLFDETFHQQRNLSFSEAMDDVVDVDARFMMPLSWRPAELLGPV